MNNVYFGMRHGQSRANTAGIILSLPEDGHKEEFGLTETGQEQARQSADLARRNGLLDNRTLVCSSFFSRAKETAQITAEALGVFYPIVLDDRLRERWFGQWERTSSANYAKVWEKDFIDPKHKERGVESAWAVQRRTMSLIWEIEARYCGKSILLVSHGDALQILQTGLQTISPALHRQITHLQVAEIRRLA